MNANRLPFYPAAPKTIDFSHRENALAARMRGDMMPPPCNASEEFAAVILKACAYDSRERYRTAAEMLEALKKLEKDSVIQTDEKKNDEPKGPFIRKYEKDEEDKWGDKEIWEPEESEGSAGSIGIDFGKIRKTEENVYHQDEDSMHSIGIDWGKKKKDEEPEAEEQEKEEDIFTPPAGEKTPKQKKGTSPKIAGLIGLAAVGVIGGSIWLSSEKLSSNQTPTETVVTNTQDAQVMSASEENAVYTL